MVVLLVLLFSADYKIYSTSSTELVSSAARSIKGVYSVSVLRGLLQMNFL